MLIGAVQGAILVLGIYLTLGVLVAIGLHVRGLQAIDTATRGAGIGFRILVTPGLIALWPILLRKWRAASHGNTRVPDPDRPLSPRSLRRAQSVTWRGMALVVVLGAALALGRRPEVVLEPVGDAPRTADSNAALSQVLVEIPDLFAEHSVVGRLRGDPSGARQLELELPNDLGVPTLALYWCPPGTRRGSDGGSEDSTPGRGAIFLGTVWGPGTRRYPLPVTVGGAGEWVLYSIARGETIATAASILEGGRP